MKSIAELIAELIGPQPGDRICNPVCGSGSLLIKCGNPLTQRGSKDCSLCSRRQGVQHPHRRN